MTTKRSTGSDASQWWKAWVLLAGFGATVLGWMVFPRDQHTPASVVISPQVTQSDETGIRRLPRMPDKPVFQAPITRTRRS
ncbi:MAG: hypothetical protein ABL986_00320 [Vicinamibacterales bacterium]